MRVSKSSTPQKSLFYGFWQVYPDKKFELMLTRRPKGYSSSA